MVYAAVGFHPTDLDKFSEQSLQQVRELAKHPKVVAVGEIGLDYYWVKEKDKRAFQREALRRQLAFAAEIEKPVVIHSAKRRMPGLGRPRSTCLIFSSSGRMD
jgi:TatD DNase family protein